MKTSAKIWLAVCVTALALGGWLTHSLFAAQARPGAQLAQAPMNTQVQVPPAFIMAVDDSGSMTFQTQFPSRDGGALWDRDSSSQPYSFFYSSDGSGRTKGALRQSDSSRQFVHVAPYPAPRQGSPGNDNAAIPPIDAFGFSRSHEINPAYFNPWFPYQPWLDYLGNPWELPDPEATRVNPRNTTPTVDLTAWRRNTSSSNSTHHAFRIREGMVLPEGMEFYDTSTARDCGLTRQVSNSIGGTNGDWRELQSDVTVSCAGANVYIGYFPATFYLKTSTESPSGYRTSRRVLVENACSFRGATGDDRCDMYRYEIKRNNYETQEAYDAAIQNFANWFTFYGNRNRAMVAGMTRSLAEVNNMKVGYFTINQRNDVTMHDMGDPDAKKALFQQVVQLPASGNTPNLPAVKHLGQQFQRRGDDAPIQLECQRNAGMLFTDGFSNVASSAPAIKGLGEPFDPTPANSLAAIASSFYFNEGTNTVGVPGNSPLRKTGFTAGKVPVPQACSTLDTDSVEWKRLDCQTNLHMNFYGVTLGARGVLFDPDTPQDPYETNPEWTGFHSNQRSTIDDIWHATVNTRGEFINARSPADIVDAMRRILTNVIGDPTPSGTLAVTGARIGAGSLTVAPSYEVKNEGTDWFGKLTAERVEVTADRQVTQVRAWEASAEMPSHSTRSSNTFFAKGADVRAFNSSNVTLADLCSSPATRYPGMARCNEAELEALGATADTAVRYLMGDTSLERRNAGDGGFRDRSSVLGDIVNSTPMVSAPRDDYGYRSLPGTIGTSYASYIESKESRDYMVYVGANDGMLHAFHGGLNASGEVVPQGGREQFAYIPATALGHMGNLLFPYDPARRDDQKFAHRYYVDGPLTISDVCGTTCVQATDWRSVLVGTSGAGGRSVFALDVSRPESFSAASRLWEISDLNTSLDEEVRDNIGFVLGKPVIVPVKIGDAVRWKAIFGNGYNSRNGKAVLFVVDLSAPFGSSSVRMLEAEDPTAPAGANGLGNVVVVDRQGLRDGFADTVYAADQKGSVWKFDLLDTANPKLTVPLFRTLEHNEGGAKYRQPIIGGMTAATGPGGGVMLYFGTGSFSFVGDPGDNSLQSLYAVNDTTDGPITSAISRSNLIGRSAVTIAGGRGLSDPFNVVLGAKGWYVDLDAGERFVGNPRIVSGVLFLPTYIPQAGSSGCSTTGLNWLFGLDARTGAAGLSNVRQGSTTGSFPTEGTASLALNTPGTAPVRDIAVNVLPRLGPAAPDPSGGGPGATPPPPTPPEQGCWMTVSASGLANGFYLPYPCGRQSWRQVQ